MANFEMIWWNFSSSIDLFFLKSVARVMKFYLFIELLLPLLLYKTIKCIINFIFHFFLFIVCRFVWPWASKNMISHDSYSCKRFSYTKAFPTKRKMEPNNFVASVVSENHVLNQSCPKICRPREHLDWEFCWFIVTKKLNLKLLI